MRKTTILFIAMLMASTLANASTIGNTGWFNDFLTLKVNGVEAPNNYYIGTNPVTGALPLQGASFGTVSTLEMSNIDMKYWSDNQDRTGGALYYKITLEDGTTQVVAPVEIIWTHAFIGGNDYRGTKPVEAVGNLNLLSGLQTGTYKLHFWAKSWGSTQADSWLSNNGTNYVATFSVVRPVTVTGTMRSIDNTYETLKQAFDSINFYQDYGNKNIEIKISGNTTETAGAALKQPTTASWNSLTIYPTAENVSITGDFIGNLIDLDGADKVTITGKLNKTGASKNLTIVNLKVDNGARTIRIWNDATINTLTQCIIKGSCSSSGAGVVFISTAVATGNDDITISYNDFNKAGSTSPYSAIYAAGTSTKMNERVIIDNNNFFNLYSGSTFYAIRLGSHNSEYTISNNNIYEPNEIIPADSKAFWGISIAASTGEKFNISNNFIGGSGVGCTGVLKKSNAFSNDFNGIFVSVSSSATDGAKINGNTVKNLEWKNATSKTDFNVIQSFGNAVNIGTTTGNTISDIVWENGAVSAGVFYGVNIQNTGGLHIAENNTISNITLNNTDASHGSNFYGIFKSNSVGSITIQNNIIRDISGLGTSTANGQIVAGVHLNYVSGTIRAFTFDISGNTFYNLSNASSRSDVGNSVYGIFVNPPQGSGAISKNKIYGISASDATLPARVVGINMDVTSTSNATICSNNMISLGNSNPGLVYGILQNTGLGKVYHNSIYIAGTVTSGAYESAALRGSVGTTTGRDYKNNICYNARTNNGAGGTHYAVKVEQLAGLTIDANNYFVSGSGGVLGNLTTDQPNLTMWKSATSQDANSKSGNVSFVDEANCDLRINTPSYQDANLQVTFLADVPKDKFDNARDSYTYAGAHQAEKFIINNTAKNFNKEIRIATISNGIEVHLTNESSIELYNASGLLIEKTKTNGVYSRSLKNGIYIININGKATKFVK